MELVLVKIRLFHICKRIRAPVDLKTLRLLDMTVNTEVDHCCRSNCMHRWIQFFSVSILQRCTGIVGHEIPSRIGTHCVIGICHRFDMMVNRSLLVRNSNNREVKIMKSWKEIEECIRLQSGMEVWSARDGVQWPSLQIIFVMDEPSGNECPFAHVMVQSVELHVNLELCGWAGRVRQSFFSCSQYGPMKFSAHEHLPGDMQMPLFLQVGKQIATIGMKNKHYNHFISFVFKPKSIYCNIRPHAILLLHSRFSKIHSSLVQVIFAFVSPFGNW